MKIVFPEYTIALIIRMLVAKKSIIVFWMEQIYIKLLNIIHLFIFYDVFFFGN